MRDICEAVNIPVVAIGGVNETNILKLKGTGIDGVSIISAIFSKDDITKATEQLLALSKEVVGAAPEIKKVLTIAGTDPTGGAGQQADLKTITVHKQYAMSVITSIVAQNTMGVYDFMDVRPNLLQNNVTAYFRIYVPTPLK